MDRGANTSGSSDEGATVSLHADHADGKVEQPEDAGSLPFFARSWRMAKMLTGGVSHFAMGMVWRGDGDFEKALDNLSRLESVLKSRIQRRGSNWRWFARSIMLWSAALEVAFLSYAIFMTQSTVLEWQKRALIVLPVFLLPACATLLYKVLAKYYRMREQQDKQALDDVQQKMKQRLDQVKDKSNFYRTLEVIQKYDNDPVVKAAAATVLGSKLGLKADLPPEIQAHVPPASTPPRSPRKPRSSSWVTPPVSPEPRASIQALSGPVPERLVLDAERDVIPPQPSYGAPGSGFEQPPPGYWQPGQHQSGGFVGMLERVAQMLVGEDPTQCYALICERCRQHNGLAKKEDLEVLMYHCRFCSHLNGTKDDNIARKCRCYFCTEIRKRTGQRLEGESGDETSAGAGRHSRSERTSDDGKAVELWQGLEETPRRKSMGAQAKEKSAEGQAKGKSAVASDGSQSLRQRTSKGAIEEGWEDLKSRLD